MLVDKVFARYGGLSGQALSRMSKDDAPWRKARKKAEANPDADCAGRITGKSMRKFFAKAKL